MTSIVENPSPTASYGLSLILPAYRSAFSSLGKVWMPLAFGGCITIATALLDTQKNQELFEELGGIGIVISLTFLAVNFVIFLMVYAKVCVGCFNAQNRQIAAPSSLFGKQEKAAFGALLEVSLASIFLSFPLLLVLVIAVATLNFVTNGEVFLGWKSNLIVSFGMLIIHRVILARYFMAIPMSIADKSSDAFKSDLLGHAWLRTQAWYRPILNAVIPIFLIGECASYLVTGGIDLAFDEGFNVVQSITMSVMNYSIFTLSTIAALHVILEIWSQTNAVEFD